MRPLTGRGLIGWVEVGAFSVVVEDDENLAWAVVGSNGMRNDGGALPRHRLDQDGRLPS